ncbi:hypothetical protein FB451DRAFT_1187696 [Mycena latifolia]|nr:hypothetical protein FB451DRAFT_1187696 [Mycena latifolia]
MFLILKKKMWFYNDNRGFQPEISTVRHAAAFARLKSTMKGRRSVASSFEFLHLLIRCYARTARTSNASPLAVAAMRRAAYVANAASRARRAGRAYTAIGKPLRLDGRLQGVGARWRVPFMLCTIQASSCSGLMASASPWYCLKKSSKQQSLKRSPLLLHSRALPREASVVCLLVPGASSTRGSSPLSIFEIPQLPSIQSIEQPLPHTETATTRYRWLHELEREKDRKKTETELLLSLHACAGDAPPELYRSLRMTVFSINSESPQNLSNETTPEPPPRLLHLSPCPDASDSDCDSERSTTSSSSTFSSASAESLTSAGSSSPPTPPKAACVVLPTSKPRGTEMAIPRTKSAPALDSEKDLMAYLHQGGITRHLRRHARRAPRRQIEALTLPSLRPDALRARTARANSYILKILTFAFFCSVTLQLSRGTRTLIP